MMETLSRMAAGVMYSERPERPMKPLPKRRLRERLTPNAADSIEYPPAPWVSAALFSPAARDKTGEIESASRQWTQSRSAPHIFGRAEDNDTPAHENDAEHLQKQATQRSEMLKSEPHHDHRYPNGQKYNQFQAPPSVTSSADGYDSFENTNNKKKRKVPTAGEQTGAGTLNDTHCRSETATASVSVHNRSYDTTRGSSSPVNGVSGPGRGRYGRSRNGRSPLQPTGDAYANTSLPVGNLSPAQSSSDLGYPPSSGIITSAIANASRLTATSDKENAGSLLHPQKSVIKPNSAAATQFTFTCDSQVPAPLDWPDSPSMIDSGVSARSQPTQSAYPHPSSQEQPQHLHNGAFHPGDNANNHDGEINGQAGPLPKESKRMARRRLARELELQAWDRKELQRQDRLDELERRRAAGEPRHKPDVDWLCSICEYEDIFQTIPRAIIHSFEMKELRKKQAEAERRRVLAKAKARGRKNKKSNIKSAAKATANDHGDAAAIDHQQTYDSHNQTNVVANGEYTTAATTGYNDSEDDEILNEQHRTQPRQTSVTHKAQPTSGTQTRSALATCRDHDHGEHGYCHNHGAANPTDVSDLTPASGPLPQAT